MTLKQGARAQWRAGFSMTQVTAVTLLSCWFPSDSALVAADKNEHYPGAHQVSCAAYASGAGIMMRRVSCINAATGEQATPGDCVAADRPDPVQQCATSRYVLPFVPQTKRPIAAHPCADASMTVADIAIIISHVAIQ